MHTRVHMRETTPTHCTPRTHHAHCTPRTHHAHARHSDRCPSQMTDFPINVTRGSDFHVRTPHSHSTYDPIDMFHESNTAIRECNRDNFLSRMVDADAGMGYEPGYISGVGLIEEPCKNYMTIHRAVECYTADELLYLLHQYGGISTARVVLAHKNRTEGIPHCTWLCSWVTMKRRIFFFSSVRTHMSVPMHN